MVLLSLEIPWTCAAHDVKRQNPLRFEPCQSLTIIRKGTFLCKSLKRRWRSIWIFLRKWPFSQQEITDVQNVLVCSAPERPETSPLGCHGPRPATDELLRRQWGASKMSVRWPVFVDEVLIPLSLTSQSWRLHDRLQDAEHYLDA